VSSEQASFFAGATPSSPEGQLRGLVERISFRSEGSDFVILKLRAPGATELVTAKGSLACALEGEEVELEGRWETDPRFGHQFVFKRAVAKAPSSLEGIERYLGSGALPGIGKSMAKRIIERFGEDTLRVIDEDTGRLTEIEGIGKKRLAGIVEALGERRLQRDAMVVLQGLGLGPRLSRRVIKTYGEQAGAVAQRDPYRLSREIRGVGFHTADRLASQAGIERDHPARLRAALRHILEEAASAGHTILPQGELIERAAQAIGQAPGALEDALLEARLAGELTRELDDSGESLVGLPELVDAERGLADALGRLRQSVMSRVPAEGHEAVVAEAAAAAGIELTADQRRAVSTALGTPVTIITGGPGVGKTTVLRSLVAALKSLGAVVALAAPTGRAAKRLEEATGHPATTIHRLLEFTPHSAHFRRGSSEPLECDAVIVDEASMIDVRLGRRLTEAVPAGGSLILVGDADQLPSVGPGSVLRDLLDSDQIPSVELREVFRQAESSAIVRNAHRIQQGDLPDLRQGRKGEPGPGDFFFIERPDAARAVETLLKMIAERIPAAYGLDPIRDVQVLTPIKRGEAGARALNQRLQERLNPGPPGLLAGDESFRPGDKVMQLRNDYDREVFNGDLGIVRSVDLDLNSLLVSFGARDLEYRGAQLDGLSLAYATTIHKSQGSEFPAVVLPMLSEHFIMLRRNLLYTAMTRARRLVVIVGQRRAIELAVSRNDTERRRTTLAERITPSEGTPFDPEAGEPFL